MKHAQQPYLAVSFSSSLIRFSRYHSVWLRSYCPWRGTRTRIYIIVDEFSRLCVGERGYRQYRLGYALPLVVRVHPR